MSAPPTFASKSGLLLDFDGPMCSVFSGSPPRDIARDLCALAQRFVPVLPQNIAETADPLEVLAWAGGIGARSLVAAVDAALRRAEVEAVESATVTAGLLEVVQLATGRGVSLAVVSNNGQESIASFLSKHHLTSSFAVVVGRPRDRPDLMKPDPHIVR